MGYNRHFETTRTGGNEAERLAALLADLHRAVRNLELTIEEEEDRIGNRDPSHYAYPIVARTMAARRDNLKATIAALEHRARPAWPSAIATRP
jgi:hypothetical protein